MVLKIVAIAALVAAGSWFLLHHGGSRLATLDPQPLTHSGVFQGMAAAMVPVLFAYGGWQTANFVAEEIREPRVNLPRALLLGVGGVVVLYLSVNFVCVAVLGPAGLAAATTPASAVMRKAFGEPGSRWIAVGIAISALGFLSQSILTAPRVYYAMAKDGVFFRAVGWVDPRHGVPSVAILLQAAMACVIALSGRYDQILSYVVSMDFLFFGLTATCLFVFRRREAGAGPSPSGLGRVPGHPVTTALFVAVSWIVVVNTIVRYPLNTAIGFGILLAGVPVYFVWRRQPHPPAPSPGGEEVDGGSGVRSLRSPYMEWSKLRSHAKYELSTSGLSNFPLAKLPARLGDLEINGPTIYGYAPLQEALAAKCGVATDCVVASQGTSMANHLAMAALFEPGDEILVEHPTYELLLSTASYLGADIRRFARRPENRFRIDPDDVAGAITPRTRLVVLTNLNNPTSVQTDEATMKAVGAIAERSGANVLVDEVYLDAAPPLTRLPPATPLSRGERGNSARSAFHLGPNFVTTSSLTKVYGLSGIRCGWILARPELAEKMWRLNDSVRFHAGAPGGAAERHRARASRRDRGSFGETTHPQQKLAERVSRLARRAPNGSDAGRHHFFPEARRRPRGRAVRDPEKPLRHERRAGKVLRDAGAFPHRDRRRNGDRRRGPRADRAGPRRSGAG